MIGRQLNFYLTVEDHQQLLEAIDAAIGCVIIKCRGPSGYEAATDFARREGEWAVSYLCQRTRCAEVLSSVLGGARNSAELLAIEFLQSIEEQGELRRGRFWYAPKYPHDRAAKPKDFTEWAAQVMTLAKRELTRVEDNWLGRRALERLESGRLRLQS